MKVKANQTVGTAAKASAAEEGLGSVAGSETSLPFMWSQAPWPAPPTQQRTLLCSLRVRTHSEGLQASHPLGTLDTMVLLSLQKKEAGTGFLLNCKCDLFNQGQGLLQPTDDRAVAELSSLRI